MLANASQLKSTYQLKTNKSGDNFNVVISLLYSTHIKLAERENKAQPLLAL